MHSGGLVSDAAGICERKPRPLAGVNRSGSTAAVAIPTNLDSVGGR
jgi:hypothetical protein